jgi:hypothetical protein
MAERVAWEDFQGSSDFKGADVHLPDGTVERIEKDRLGEPLFRFAAKDQMLNAHQMLQTLLHQTKSSLQDYIRQSTIDEAAAKGEGRIKPLFQANIAKGGFQFLKDGGLVDFDKLLFDVELVVRPRTLTNSESR